MNWKTTFHLVRTELHRNLWIIVALWIVAILVTDIFLSGLVAGLLIAQGDHLTRPAAHWRCRPVSLLTWSVSRVLLLFFLILIPVTIQQGWIAHSRGFDQGATMWAMIEVAVITSVFISVMFALATAASNWVTFAFLIAAVFTYAAVAGMIAADWSDFSRRDPPGVRSFYTSNSYHAWPLPWWIFWLGTISVSLGVLFLHGKLRQGKLTFLSLGIGVTAFVVGVMWAEGSAYQIRIQNVSGEIALVETSKEDRPSAMQKVYQNIGISGLEDGQFVEVKTIRAKGKIAHYENRLSHPRDKAEIEDRFQGRQALVRLLPPGHRVFSLDDGLSEFIGARLDQSLFEFFKDPSVTQMGLGGEVFQWVDLGAVPIKPGKARLKKDLFCQVTRSPANYESSGNRFYRMTLRRPSLTLSPNPTENAISGGWQGINRIAIVASHGELKETVILIVQSGRYASSDAAFGLEKSVDIDVKIQENPNWKILWPEGNPTDQWLAGAEFRIYGQECSGQLEAELDLVR